MPSCRHTYLFAIALLILALPSCKKETDPPFTQTGPGYYPLYVGRSVTYLTDSTIWDDFSRTQTTRRYFMRYDLADTFRDNAGRLSYRVDVYERLLSTADTADWALKSNFYVTQTGSGLELVQNNLRFLKLTFPVTPTRYWNGNVYIPVSDPAYQYFNNWNYHYTKTGAPYSGLIGFDTTVTVEHIDYALNNPAVCDTCYAERTFSREVYDFRAGLIDRAFVRWTYDRNPATNQFYRHGDSVVMQAVAHN